MSHFKFFVLVALIGLICSNSCYTSHPRIKITNKMSEVIYLDSMKLHSNNSILFYKELNETIKPDKSELLDFTGFNKGSISKLIPKKAKKNYFFSVYYHSSKNKSYYMENSCELLYSYREKNVKLKGRNINRFY